jgi:hypothetical protein
MPASNLPTDSEEFRAFELWLGLEKRSYSRLEAAEVIGVSEAALDRLIAAGEIPTQKVTKQRTAIWCRDLAAFMFRHRRAETSSPVTSPAKAPTATPKRGRGKPRTNPVSRIPKSEAI